MGERLWETHLYAEDIRQDVPSGEIVPPLRPRTFLSRSPAFIRHPISLPWHFSSRPIERVPEFRVLPTSNSREIACASARTLLIARRRSFGRYGGTLVTSLECFHHSGGGGGGGPTSEGTGRRIESLSSSSTFLNVRLISAGINSLARARARALMSTPSITA